MTTLSAHHMADVATTVVVVAGAGEGRHDALVSLDGGPPTHLHWAGHVAAWCFPGRVIQVTVAVDGAEARVAKATAETPPC